jgi:hypothetical protein
MEHEYFGWIETDGGRLDWSETLESGDQPVEVRLAGPAGVSEEALELAASVVRGLEPLDANLREVLISEVTQQGSATVRFLDLHLDELLRLRPQILGQDSGDIAIDVIRSLQLMSVTVLPAQSGEDEPFVIAAYALDPDEADVLLLVRLDATLEPLGTELER